jgi:hypothetical protein
MTHNKLSSVSKPIRQYYVIVLFLLLLPVMLSRVEVNPRAVIWSDAEGYYQYLPGLLIIKDFHALPPGSIWPQYNAEGEYVNKYTSGVAIFELPFFMAAYLLSQPLGYDAVDYYNPVYCYAIAICGFFFAFLGLWVLQKSLLRWVSPGITFWVIISVFFGTNLFHYATKEMSVAHVFNFFLFSVFLFHLPHYLKNPKPINSLLLGGVLGWIILIRPTNIIIALLLLLYDVYSRDALQARIHFYFKHFTSLLWIALAAFVFFIPQMMYWKEMTGHWLYYSYTDEGFIYWNQPKILAVLFDTQNGLFLYSPLVMLMFIGMFLGLRKNQFHAPAVLVIISIATYIFASWWAWWFGGSFSHRCYVDFYPLLAIPLAGLYQWVTTRWKLIYRIGFYSLVILLMAFSVRLSYLYTSIGGPWDGPEWRWNWEKYGWVLEHLF